MGPAFKHYMNPLHVYCRLRDLGVPKGAATFVCRFYEFRVFNKYILKKDPGIVFDDLGQPPFIPESLSARTSRTYKRN